MEGGGEGQVDSINRNLTEFKPRHLFKVTEIYICSIVLNDLQLLEGKTHVVINGFISAPPTTDSASYGTFVGIGGPLVY